MHAMWYSIGFLVIFLDKRKIESFTSYLIPFVKKNAAEVSITYYKRYHSTGAFYSSSVIYSRLFGRGLICQGLRRAISQEPDADVLLNCQKQK
ncbi:hypothetical protein T4A_4875 [Trichinella pseudospiralis]|uniref:Uncharacterized protein n=1 Tax=Trichinella pseudospiralis TaxID=6337 RepID=A0A0V1DWB5_TRIPS|nr:hypothetical protein T4A_4875 [Trichinella pseudospiralis]KRZ42037.1 hypothetical protein T4C_3541 [Trichinella pseudospiralis]